MGWHVSDTWMDALSAPHTLRWLVSSIRGDQVLADNMEVSDVTCSASLSDDATQITRELKCNVTDATRELLSTNPMSPLAPWGQRVQVRAEISVGAAYSELIPVGEFRIESVEGDAATAVLQRNGSWLYGGQQVQVTARDMLQQLADEAWTTPLQRISGNTDVQELARILAGTGIPISPSMAFVRRPGWGVNFGSTRLDAALTLADAADRALWIDRSGALDWIDPKVGTGTGWSASPGEDVWVSWTPGADRGHIKNGVLVQGSTDAAQYGVRGADWIRSGPLAWGGPFGRVPEVISSSTALSSAQAAAEAKKTLAAIGAARTAQVVVTEPANPAKDVLDTQHIVTDDRTLTGLITGIDISGDATMKTTVSIPWEQVWIS